MFASQSDLTSNIGGTSKNIKEVENFKNEGTNTVYSSFKEH